MKTRADNDAAAADRDLRRIDRMLAEAAPEANYLIGKFRLGAEEGEEPLACNVLFDTTVFDDILGRLTKKHGSTDRRALVSYWSLFYLSTLSIAPIVLWRRAGLLLPLDFDRTSVLVSKETGLPEAFVIDHAGVQSDTLNVFEALHGIIGHLETAIAQLCGHYGVSPRLLWNNAAGYINWILREMAAKNSDIVGIELFDEPKLPDGTTNPFHGLITQIHDPETGEPVSRRKVCCLRYLLPGVSGCGMVCPLPSGRA